MTCVRRKTHRPFERAPHCSAFRLVERGARDLPIALNPLIRPKFPVDFRDGMSGLLDRPCSSGTRCGIAELTNDNDVLWIDEELQIKVQGIKRIGVESAYRLRVCKNPEPVRNQD